jgi:16S rRNA (uracil1498-N3)-methyltransferase
VNLFYQPLITENVNYLDEEESRHCSKVLRKRSGDQIFITDGKGCLYNARIINADPRKCEFEIIGKQEEKTKAFSIHIAIAPTKNPDRMEWFVEKSVEFGIDHITLMECENSERSFLKIDRLRKVAISAMKQSFKTTLPVIDGMMPFKNVVAAVDPADQKFVAFVDPGNPLHLKGAAKKNGNYLVLIGPEGDFSEAELDLAIQREFQKVSLGSSRLRTETAGIAACHILNLINSL